MIQMATLPMPAAELNAGFDDRKWPKRGIDAKLVESRCLSLTDSETPPANPGCASFTRQKDYRFGQVPVVDPEQLTAAKTLR